jgi:MFS family permease
MVDSEDAALSRKSGSNYTKDAQPTVRQFRFLGPTSGSSWVSSVLPFSIALGPMGTLVQLLILNFNGTVVEVGLAITLFNAVSIPAALFWGFVTDRFHRRRP